MKRSQSNTLPGPARDTLQPLLEPNDPRSQLIERILASHQFRGSLRLREFLLYIAESALKATPETVNEQQIGVHVFARPPGYNSSEDSIVRTHARLLRLKLGEYFSTDGATESVIVEVPKGHYLPVFRLRTSDPPPAPFQVAAELKPIPPPAAPAPEVVAEAVAEVVAESQQWWKTWAQRPSSLIMGIISLLILAGLGFLMVRQGVKPVRTPIEVFWGPFLTGESPVVIYSNARFVGDSKNGLRYAPAGVDPLNQPMVDHYTGIGELTSVYELTRLFDAHHSAFILKRSLLVTWDEAKQRNLVFIGSPAENPSLNAVPSPTDFTMQVSSGSAGFINNHPRTGEQAVYSRPEHPLTMDYAVIALMPGVQSGKRTLIFSGLTTLGTQAAVEYASRKDTLAELLKSVSAPNGEVRPFEALLSVTLEGGVPLQSKLISVHVH